MNYKGEIELEKFLVNDSELAYDLEERTATFGEDIIKFSKSLKITAINRSLISQLIRSGTSIGANYMEANGAESGRDFKHKIALCRKEAREVKHWLRMIKSTEPKSAETCNKLYKETDELVRIFSAIIKTYEQNQKKNK